MAKTLQLADTARNQISNIPELSVLQPGETTPGFVALDRTRLTVTVSELGLTGFAADEILAEHGVIAELPSLQHLTFIISLGNTEADIERLVQGFTTLAKNYRPNSLTLKNPEWDNFFSKLGNYTQISPREAFFAVRETLPIEQTRDRISTELVCPYPPGIPVLLPGEVITSEAIDYLQKVQAGGGFISGCADANLRTLEVVKGNLGW